MARYSPSELQEKIYSIHDRDINQKYGGDLPYSFHLKAVKAQGIKFTHLWDQIWTQELNTILESDIQPKERVDINDLHNVADLRFKVLDIVLVAHDLIEDARMTWSDVCALCRSTSQLHQHNTLIADIIYDVTDEKGKTREDRKNVRYYEALRKNQLAIFVKLADIAANTLFSKLTGSSMYEKYKQEFPQVRAKLYPGNELLKEMFDYVENL